MERRIFLKKSCSLCIAIAGGTALTSILSSCAGIPLYKTTSRNRKINIPLSQFAKNDFLIVRPSDLNYDIAVVKMEDSKYKSMIMECTHADNALRFNGNQFTCDVHGSVFSRTGTVEKGPAERPLISLKTETQTDQVIISLL